MLRDMFKKTYTLIDTKYADRNAQDGTESGDEPNIPKGLWRKCNKCGRPIYTEDVKNNYYVCPRCSGYFRVHAYRRIEMIIDEGTFEEWNQEMEFVNPIGFPGYEKKITAAREKSSLNEAVVTGRGKVHGQDTVIAVCDSRFLMSSMGHNVGEKITRAVERATEEKLPVVIFAASGGARMQEGLVSLMQMAKTSAALKRHSDAGFLYVSVLTDPTTGGVTASFAMLGDVILAEPGALIGFAGPRVIEQTIHQKLPEGFQRAEFLVEHGFVDRIVERKDQKEVLGRIIKLHSSRRSWKKNLDEESRRREAAARVCAREAALLAAERSRAEASETPALENAAEKITVDQAASEIAEKDLPEKVKEAIKSRIAPFSGVMRQKTLDKITGRQQEAWDTVLASRSAGRLVASDYIRILFDGFIEMHGDRYFGDDGAIIGGVASFYGMPVTVIGQEKGKTTKDNLKCNFGMPSPEGYRKALRLMKQAEKFNRPVICFVDTPGAFCGLEAEERGQGEAIARNLFEMADLKVPMLTIVIGEGGSGGALAMAVANEVWMMENSIYSVLSPEGFASILWKDSKRASEAAKVMKMTARDLYELGLIERIIPEDHPASIENIELIGQIIDRHMREFFKTCELMTPEELVSQRYDRFRKF